MLVYNDPINAARTETIAPASGARLTIAASIATLCRHRWSIMIAAFIGGALALTFGELSSPRYTATTQLYLDPRDLRLVSREVTPVSQDAGSYMSIVESQTRVITSRSVLERVVATLKLEEDPEFGGASAGASTGLLSRLGFRTAAPSQGGKPGANALDALERRITIRRPEKTFIVDISVWAGTAEKAAKLANAIAEAYLAEDSESRTNTARRATASLSSRLEELRERVRAAENRVEAYKSRNNLIGTRETLVSDQQLTEMNQQLSAARARTAQARARYEQMIAARQSGTFDGAIAEALNSQTMATLRGQYAELRRRQADLVNSLGPLHPSVKSVDVQVRDLQRLIQQEIGRYIESARNELETARANEASLESTLDNLKRRAVQSNEASVQLRELEREVDASRAIYESFLVRAREIGEQERLNTTSARIISEASAPTHRSFPPRLSLLTLVGLFFGLAAGCALAFFRDWLGMVPPPSATPSIAPAPRQAATPARVSASTLNLPPRHQPAAAMQAARTASIRWKREPIGGFPQNSFSR